MAKIKQLILLVFIYLLSPSSFSAGQPVTHIFSAGGVIKSTEINNNYQELVDRIDTLSNSTTPWSFVGNGSSDNVTFNITTIPAVQTYILKEVVRTSNNINTNCILTAGSSLIDMPGGTNIVSLTQGITLMANDVISMKCQNGSGIIGSISTTVSGIRF